MLTVSMGMVEKGEVPPLYTVISASLVLAR